jgi:hypothetical protein
MPTLSPWSWSLVWDHPKPIFACAQNSPWDACPMSLGLLDLFDQVGCVNPSFDLFRQLLHDAVLIRTDHIMPKDKFYVC